MNRYVRNAGDEDRRADVLIGLEVAQRIAESDSILAHGRGERAYTTARPRRLERHSFWVDAVR